MALELTQLHGLAPLYDSSIQPTPRWLILGSMPSVSSLGEQQYYAHPQNQFWPIMANLFQFDSSLNYSDRCQALLRQGVVLWDVIGSCQRQGSLDASIIPQSIQINNIPELLEKFPTIRKIGCNGGMAYRLFKKHVQPNINTEEIDISQLSSSSPANARYRLAEKITQWQQALLS